MATAAAVVAVVALGTDLGEDPPPKVAPMMRFEERAAEIDRYLTGLPGVENARIFEPEPEVVYAWER